MAVFRNRRCPLGPHWRSTTRQILWTKEAHEHLGEPRHVVCDIDTETDTLTVYPTTHQSDVTYLVVATSTFVHSLQTRLWKAAGWCPLNEWAAPELIHSTTGRPALQLQWRRNED